MSRLTKIVLTGAPSSGKSTVLEELSRLDESVILVPEAARMLLAGGYPVPDLKDLEQVKAFQRAIIPVHECLELAFERVNPNSKLMVLDRAIIDGAGFWPKGADDYFRTFGVDYQKNLDRYDHVIFMELPEEKFFGGVIKERFHNYSQSLESARKLESVWSKHKSLHRVRAEVDFNKKKDAVIQLIKSFVRP